MKSERLEIRLTGELLAQVDEARGDVSRTRWLERAIERQLGKPSRSALAVRQPEASFERRGNIARSPQQKPVPATPLPKIAPRGVPWK